MPCSKVASFRAALLFGLAVGLGLAHAGMAQGDYPSRTVRIIVPATAGGGSDTFARLIAQHLSKELNQQFVVENRPGAAPSPPWIMSRPTGRRLHALPVAGNDDLHALGPQVDALGRPQGFPAVTQIAVVPQSLVINPKVPGEDGQGIHRPWRSAPGRNFHYGLRRPRHAPHMAMELFNS